MTHDYVDLKIVIYDEKYKYIYWLYAFFVYFSEQQQKSTQVHKQTCMKAMD